MRVGMVTTSYPRTPGDPAGSFVAGFARWLARRGHAVDVVAAGPGMDRDGDGVTVARVHAGAGLFYDEGAPDRLERLGWRAGLRAPLFGAALAARVATAARRGRWEAVVSHWLLPSALAARAARRPHLAIAHSGDVHLCVKLGAADVVARGLGRGARVAFVAEHLRDRFLGAVRSSALRDGLAARAMVCPMGIDVPAFRAARSRDRHAAAARFGVAPDRKVVAFLGRLVPIKGVEVLVEAMRALPDAVLVIGGDGPMRRASAGNVIFAGELRGEARDDLFALADAWTLPSLPLPGGRGEGAPVVALEALAAGIPLVASNVAGVRQLCGDAIVRLVPPGDARALAAALHTVVYQPTAPDSHARIEAGRTLAALHDWDRIGERLLGGWNCQGRLVS